VFSTKWVFTGFKPSPARAITFQDAGRPFATNFRLYRSLPVHIDDATPQRKTPNFADKSRDEHQTRLASRKAIGASWVFLGALGVYFYIDNYGWIDARHFGEAAGRVHGEKGFPTRPALVKIGGLLVEVWQLFTESTGRSQGHSALPSNAAGADFGLYLRWHPEMDVATAFNKWAKENGARNRSDPKSGFRKLPVQGPGEP
jgi:hypothetical protein